MAEAISTVAAQLEKLRETIDSQKSEINYLNREVSYLMKENRALKRQLAQYERNGVKG